MNEIIIRDEMHELLDLVAKYSSELLTAMLTALDIDTLHENMVERGATREEMLTAAETHHDVTTFYDCN